MDADSPKIHCPYCASVDVVFKSKAQVWECNTCEQRFALPAAGAKPAIKIFLSYGHDGNGILVQRIKADLETRGYGVWFDRSDIKSGDDWRRAITDGIVASDWMLSFLSSHSTRDPGVCLDELGIALSVKGSIVQTILVESEQQVSAPLSVGHIQWLDMHDWQSREENDPGAFEAWYQAKFNEILRVIESDSHRRFAGEIQTLEASLKPNNCDARIGSLLNQGFFGRAWLVQEIELWRLNDWKSRVFFVTGPPGTGKSALSAWIAHHGKLHLIAAQFIEHEQPSRRDPCQVIRSIAFQIATRLPDYRSFLIRELERQEVAKTTGPVELFDCLLANPLTHAIKGGRDRYLILIDALDEAGDDGGNTLVQLLAGQVAKLPDWIGVVVTSRPEPEILRALSHLAPHELLADDKRNTDDLRSFLEAWLKKRPADDRPVHTVPDILEAADGNFLYLRQFCEGVENGLIELDKPASFPCGLTGIYAHFFSRRFPDLEHYGRYVLPLLEVMLAAREPLSEQSAISILGWKRRDWDGTVLALGSMLSLRSARLHFFHKSLGDWLADRDRAGAYRAYASDGNLRIVAALEGQYQRGVEMLDEYGLAHLPAHLRATGRDGECSALLCDLSYAKARYRPVNEPHIGEDYRCLDTLSLSHARACYQLVLAGQASKNNSWYSDFSWFLASTLANSLQTGKLDAAAVFYGFAGRMWMYDENYFHNDKIPDEWICRYLQQTKTILAAVSRNTMTPPELALCEKLEESLVGGLAYYAS